MVWIIVLSHSQSLEFFYVCVCFAKIHKFVFLTNVKLFLSIWKLRNYTENKANSRKLPKKISRFLSRQLPPRQWHASANIRMCSSIFELFAQYLEKFWLFVVVVFLVSNLTLKTLANIRPFDSGDDTWSLWLWTASPQNSLFQYLCFFLWLLRFSQHHSKEKEIFVIIKSSSATCGKAVAIDADPTITFFLAFWCLPKYPFANSYILSGQ